MQWISQELGLNCKVVAVGGENNNGELKPKQQKPPRLAY